MSKEANTIAQPLRFGIKSDPLRSSFIQTRW